MIPHIVRNNASVPGMVPRGTWAFRPADWAIRLRSWAHGVGLGAAQANTRCRSTVIVTASKDGLTAPLPVLSVREKLLVPVSPVMSIGAVTVLSHSPPLPADSGLTNLRIRMVQPLCCEGHETSLVRSDRRHNGRPADPEFDD